MEKIKLLKPIIDIQSTGKQIKKIRTESGFSVKDIQEVFGFEYPQAVYAWEQGKNVPTIDNLLVLSRLFEVSIEELIVTKNVEVEVLCSASVAQKICQKKCEVCKLQLSA